jgi:hypothetical protein
MILYILGFASIIALDSEEKKEKYSHALAAKREAELKEAQSRAHFFARVSPFVHVE